MHGPRLMFACIHIKGFPVTIRKVVFWSHLGVGIAIGFVLAVLALTGALLTFEMQITRAVETGMFTRQADGPPMSAAALAQAALTQSDGKALSLTFASDTDAPVVAATGRSAQLFLDPVSGTVLGTGASRLRGFFDTVEGLHRWLGLQDASRDVARALIGAANLGFLFLVLSGLWLWVPRKLTWRMLRANLLFRRGLPTARARDYNWHHVFGIWTLLPLVLIVGTGVTLSYSWARDAVYVAAGVEGATGRAAPATGPFEAPAALNAAFDAAQAVDPAWHRITLSLPAPHATAIMATVDAGSGRQATQETAVTFDIASGEINKTMTWADQPASRQLGAFLRFGHTGEFFGIIGQTVAGLASLATLISIFTGLALAWRRLIQPFLRRARTS